MRSVEMIVEFPIEDANLPMPHLLGLANAAPDCRGARGRRGEAGLGAADAGPADVRVPELRHHDFCRRKHRAGRGREVIETMVGVLVLALLALVTAYLWQDWCTNTREFREMRRMMMQAQEERRGGEKK